MIALFKYLKGCLTRESQQDLFCIIPKCKTQNNGFKVQEDSFQLNITEQLTIKLITQRNSGHPFTGYVQMETRQSLVETIYSSWDTCIEKVVVLQNISRHFLLYGFSVCSHLLNKQLLETKEQELVTGFTTGLPIA